jgi:hypothetical protein
MNRKQFISTLAGATAGTVLATTAATGGSTASSGTSASSKTVPNHKVKRGVSIYSYQRAMMEKGMTLRDCLEEMSDIGAYGVEYMTQAMRNEYPSVSDKWVDEWWKMMDKFGTVPDCLTGFVDSCRRLKPMTVEENVAFLERDFKIAKRLGLTKARIGPPAWVIEAAIPVAEKYGIWMGWEIHSPMLLKNELVDWVVKKAEKYPHAIGFVPDMGIFQKYPRPFTRETQIKAGTLTRDIALYIEDAYKKGLEKAEVAGKVKGMNPKPGDTNYVETVYRAGANCNNPKDLIPLIPYIKHVHGKCHEMTKGDEFKDTTMIYDEVIPVLMEHGFDGYIATEFEGQRVGGVEDIDEVEEVRRHQLMLKRLLGA